MTWTNALRGTGGEFEVNRFLGGIGVLSYIFCANAFVAWEVFAKDRDFDLIAYCTAFPAGLGAALLAIGGAVKLKDQAVAKSREPQRPPPHHEGPQA